jgi:hypothetical protein
VRRTDAERGDEAGRSRAGVATAQIRGGGVSVGPDSLCSQARSAQLDPSPRINSGVHRAADDGLRVGRKAPESVGIDDSAEHDLAGTSQPPGGPRNKSGVTKKEGM